MQCDPQLMEQWARRAGQHAPPLLFIMLAVRLATTCTSWWIVWRYSGCYFRFARLPIRFLSLRVAAGLTVILLGSSSFAELAGELAARETLGRVDRALRDSVATPVAQTFAVTTHFGDTATLVDLCIAVANALVALGRWWPTLGLVAAVAGNGGLNVALKQISARARPLGLDVLTVVTAGTYELKARMLKSQIGDAH